MCLELESGNNLTPSAWHNYTAKCCHQWKRRLLAFCHPTFVSMLLPATLVGVGEARLATRCPWVCTPQAFSFFPLSSCLHPPSTSRAPPSTCTPTGIASMMLLKKHPPLPARSPRAVGVMQRNDPLSPKQQKPSRHNEEHKYCAAKRG